MSFVAHEVARMGAATGGGEGGRLDTGRWRRGTQRMSFAGRRGSRRHLPKRQRCVPPSPPFATNDSTDPRHGLRAGQRYGLKHVLLHAIILHLVLERRFELEELILGFGTKIVPLPLLQVGEVVSDCL